MSEIGQRSKQPLTISFTGENREGEEVTRTLFGYDGQMEKAQAYRMIDEAGTTYIFFRIMISPDPEKEDGEKRPGSLGGDTTDYVANGKASRN